MLPSVTQIIGKLNLVHMPHGNYFLSTYVSDVAVPGVALPPRFGGERVLSSAIYNLFIGPSIVPLHVLQVDEMWHCYMGNSPIVLVMFDIPTKTVSQVWIGSDVMAGQVPQYLVKHNTWVGAYLPDDDVSRWILTGATLAPGFNPADVQEASQEHMLTYFPEFKDLIIKLTPNQTTLLKIKEKTFY